MNEIVRSWSALEAYFRPESPCSPVTIKLNSDFNCTQAYDLFISDPDLLNLVKTTEKMLKIKLFI